jgi:tRNA 2-thiouridine synthesizing protein A
MTSDLPADPPVLDLRGLNCPLPVLKTRKAMTSMSPGARLWVETTDPLAEIDLPNYCVESGNRLIARERAGNAQRFLIERA